MNKAWRCTARDADNHRCQHKAGHGEGERPTKHIAFGRSWSEIESLARPPDPVRTMLDGSPCWCVSDDEPHEGWVHAPRCDSLRAHAFELTGAESDLASVPAEIDAVS